VRPPPRAFTLLEVLLAVTLLIALCGAVYGTYQGILSARDGIRRNAGLIFAQRRVLDLLSEDLQSGIVYPLLQVGLEGDAESMALMRTALPSGAVFIPPRLTQAPSIASDPSDPHLAAYAPQHDIQRVGYRLNRYEDEDGVEHIGGLERTTQRTVSARTAEEGSDIEVVLLSERVKFIRFRYWDGAAWTDSWSGGGLPAAVRIDLGSEPLPEDLSPEEYPYPTVWRIVAIPAAGGGTNRRGGHARGSTPRDAFQPQDIRPRQIRPRDVIRPRDIRPRDVFQPDDRRPGNVFRPRRSRP